MSFIDRSQKKKGIFLLWKHSTDTTRSQEFEYKELDKLKLNFKYTFLKALSFKIEGVARQIYKLNPK